jgi:hypothetical protein
METEAAAASCASFSKYILTHGDGATPGPDYNMLIMVAVPTQNKNFVWRPPSMPAMFWHLLFCD